MSLFSNKYCPPSSRVLNLMIQHFFKEYSTIDPGFSSKSLTVSASVLAVRGQVTTTASMTPLNFRGVNL